jgi:hypothetical protein
MTGLRTDLTVSVLLNGVPVNCRPVAKDGADLPVDLQFLKPALDQSVTVGQTRDFEFSVRKRGKYLFVVKDYQDQPVLTSILRVR